MTSTFIHDPQSTLDYAQDWSRWLSADEHITSHLVTATQQYDWSLRLVVHNC